MAKSFALLHSKPFLCCKFVQLIIWRLFGHSSSSSRLSRWHCDIATETSECRRKASCCKYFMSSYFDRLIVAADRWLRWLILRVIQCMILVRTGNIFFWRKGTLHQKMNETVCYKLLSDRCWQNWHFRYVLLDREKLDESQTGKSQFENGHTILFTTKWH